MKTETQVQIQIRQIQALQHLFIEPEGFVLKFFMSSSQIYSRPFRFVQQPFQEDQLFQIRNIIGDQLQVWLCSTEDKIIAYSTVTLLKQGSQQSEIQLKLNNTPLAKLHCNLNITKKEIQKVLYVQPDEELLKREEDPEVVRKREQQEQRRLREKEEMDKLAQQQKKHAITKTHRNKKDQPFL